MRNTLIINNVGRLGGGIYLEDGVVENCTVARNDNKGVSSLGGGIYRGAGTVTNSIIYYNYSTRTDAGSGPNNIYGASDSVFGFNCTTGLTHGANGNITNEPKFVSAGSGYGLTAEVGDYRLQPSSPCVDKGAYLSWMNGATDRAGKKRIFRGVVDMGAFEDDTPRGTVICIR
jgi:hypothetical protein